jgi:DNA-directed RNA polymerase I, II, and III subunit RPABC1
VKHAILVYEGTPTPAVKAVIANLPELEVAIELFHADDLQFNITKHELVPKHEKLPLQEAKEFKACYGTNIPTLLRTDAVVRFYDFHKGEIIKVTRKNSAISYRIVR